MVMVLPLSLNYTTPNRKRKIYKCWHSKDSVICRERGVSEGNIVQKGIVMLIYIPNHPLQLICEKGVMNIRSAQETTKTQTLLVTSFTDVFP